MDSRSGDGGGVGGDGKRRGKAERSVVGYLRIRRGGARMFQTSFRLVSLLVYVDG